ncbi:MAG: rod-binding protein [Sphingorhabdus sp.]|jgi:flagellar protein FlgJ|nr:rod-binding protein [Sphingorhabdus sp.]
MTFINPNGNPVAAPPNQASAKADAKAQVKAMAADFEAIFVRQMLSSMRTASLGEGIFDGQGMEEFRDMQDAQLAKSMGEKGVFGVADMLSRHLDKTGVTGNKASQYASARYGEEAQ